MGVGILADWAIKEVTWLKEEYLNFISLNVNITIYKLIVKRR